MLDITYAYSCKLAMNDGGVDQMSRNMPLTPPTAPGPAKASVHQNKNWEGGTMLYSPTLEGVTGLLPAGKLSLNCACD